MNTDMGKLTKQVWSLVQNAFSAVQLVEGITISKQDKGGECQDYIGKYSLQV